MGHYTDNLTQEMIIKKASRIKEMIIKFTPSMCFSLFLYFFTVDTQTTVNMCSYISLYSVLSLK